MRYRGVTRAQVCAPSFEAPKHDIEVALSKHVEALLGQQSDARRARAA